MTTALEPVSVAAGHERGPGTVHAPEGPHDDERQHRSLARHASGSPHKVALSAVLPTITSLVGSAALLTGIAFTFGYAFAGQYFAYFGLPITVLNLPTSDYLRLSAGALFYGTGILLLIGLLMLRGYEEGHRRKKMGRPPIAIQRVSALMAVVGFVVLLVGASASFVPALQRLPNHALLATGFVLGTYAWVLRRAVASPKDHSADAGMSPELGWAPGLRTSFVAAGLLLSTWALLLTLAGWMGGFNADYAFSKLRESPSFAVVRSEQRLALEGPGVREVVSTEADSHQFVYDGLLMLWHGGGKYVFIPTGWSPDNKVVFTVPDAAGVRVDFRSSERAGPTDLGAPRRVTGEDGVGPRP